MPRAKKAITTDHEESEPLIPQQEDFNLMTSISTSDTKDISPDIQVSLPKIPKKEFKHLHIKDNYWLENDISQTIADLTDGKKGAKALIINQALKDYFEKNKLEIKPLRAKVKK